MRASFFMDEIIFFRAGGLATWGSKEARRDTRAKKKYFKGGENENAIHSGPVML